MLGIIDKTLVLGFDRILQIVYAVITAVESVEDCCRHFLTGIVSAGSAIDLTGFRSSLIHCKEDKEQRVQKPIPDIILDGADEEKNFESTQLHVEKFVKE